jgi:phosphohistidine phosphatase
MEILLVRHAAAEELSAGDGLDAQRRLTDKGRKQFRALAEWLVEQGQDPDAIVSSPLVRAVQTAEILRKAADLDSDASRVEEPVGPGLQAAKLLEIVQHVAASRVAVVAHEPDISRCAADLIGGGNLKFAKGAVACIEFAEAAEIGKGQLKWLVCPKLVKS